MTVTPADSLTLTRNFRPSRVGPEEGRGGRSVGRLQSLKEASTGAWCAAGSDILFIGVKQLFDKGGALVL